LRRIRIGAIAFTLGFLAILSLASSASAQAAGTADAASAATTPAPAETSPPALLVNSPARFGLGLNVGNVLTGVTAKLWAASSVAFQAAVGEGAEGNNLRAHLDLLFSVSTWTSADGQYVLPAYLGIGGVLGHHFAAGASASDTEGGFRIPLGMSVLVRGNPVELFFEIAPAFTVRSDATLRGKYGVYTDGAIGARYYF
jgi:hypothetical protein